MDTGFNPAIAIAVVALLPPIIWINYHHRQGGLSGYLWRESPIFVHIMLALLFTVWLGTAFDLAAHYGFLSARALEILNTLIGAPMLILSLCVLVLGTRLLIRYLRLRSGP
jgi:hypothetical protein